LGNRSGSQALTLCGPVLDRAQMHARECSDCASKLAEIRSLDTVLDEFRVATSQASPGSNVEPRLLAAFRQQRQMSSSSRSGHSRWTIAWKPVAALLVIVLGLVYLSTWRAKPDLAQKVGHSSSNDGSVELNQVATAASPSQHEHSGTSRTRKTRTGPEPPRPLRLPKPDEVTQEIDGSIVRITLPSSALAVLGISVHPDLADRRVTADVMMDSFGVVRGIRLVGSESKAN
jgi:hypothetical protein